MSRARTRGFRLSEAILGWWLRAARREALATARDGRVRVRAFVLGKRA